MSDIPPIDPTSAEPPPEDPTATEDPEFLSLVDRLSPYFGDIAAAAAQAAIESTPVPSIKPGVVTGVGSDRTCSVLIDGDTSPITAQIICENPYVNARVLVEFVPPSAVFVIGFASQGIMPPGLIMPYTGSISIQAGAANTSGGQTTGEPPGGWLWCTGGTVSRATYAALFAVIGTTFGSGDGATTFTLPDLRGRIPIGMDNMGGSDAARIGLTNAVGTAGGTNTIGTANLPTHTHTLGDHTHYVSIGTDSQGSHNHSDSGHGHSDSGHTHLNAWGSSYVVAAGGNYPASGSDGGNTGVGYANIGTGYANIGYGGSHSHTASGTSDGPSSDTTGNGEFANNEFLPPVMVMHYLIKT